MAVYRKCCQFRTVDERAILYQADILTDIHSLQTRGPHEGLLFKCLSVFQVNSLQSAFCLAEGLTGYCLYRFRKGVLATALQLCLIVEGRKGDQCLAILC